jgi:hypothetical protein
MTVCDVCADLMRHPIRGLIHRWHWKSATLSAIVRGALFFATNLTDGPGMATRAMLVECGLRVPLVGVLAAVTQAFGRAEPPWAAAVVAMALLPGLAHVTEFVVHWAAGTPELRASIVASIAMSALSTVFTLFAVRRGVMVVGHDSQSFRDDLKRLPRMIVEFVLAPARALGRALGRAPDRVDGRRGRHSRKSCDR